MEQSVVRRPQSLKEEILNSTSHALGLVALLVAAPFLILEVVQNGTLVNLAGAGIFILSAALVYISSTLYHAITSSRAKQFLRLLDHSAIYLLIAGTYTPFTLGVLQGVWGWTLLGTVWSLALAGVIFKAIFGVRYPAFSLTLYVIMGWLIVIAAKPFLAVMDPAGIAWLVAGGLSYMVGVIFFALERIPYFHFIWHLFVLLGTGFHFVAILRYAI